MSKQHNWDYPNDLLESAWILIANAFEGNWEKAPTEWLDAAIVWRNAYHEALSSIDGSDSPKTPDAQDTKSAEEGK